MFKSIIAAALISVSALVAADSIIASWDFSKENALTSTDMPFILRHAKGETDGGAKIENGFLICSRAKGEDKPNGIQSAKAAFPLFSPQGAFKFTADFKFEENLTRQGVMATLFDNKYVGIPNEKQAQFHRGFQIALRVYPGNKFAPRASFGFGDKSKEVSAKTVVMENGKLHHLEVIFTGKGEVKFIFNGQELSVCKVPEGSISPSKLPTTIGDRHGSSYAALGGAIAKVELIKLDDNAFTAPATEEAAAPAAK